MWWLIFMLINTQQTFICVVTLFLHISFVHEPPCHAFFCPFSEHVTLETPTGYPSPSQRVLLSSRDLRDGNCKDARAQIELKWSPSKFCIENIKEINIMFQRSPCIFLFTISPPVHFEGDKIAFFLGGRYLSSTFLTSGFGNNKRARQSHIRSVAGC